MTEDICNFCMVEAKYYSGNMGCVWLCAEHNKQAWQISFDNKLNMGEENDFQRVISKLRTTIEEKR